MPLFVLLPLSISILLLLGFAVSNVWHEPGGGLFGVVFVVGLLVYLGVVTVKLARFRPGALQLAGCLLALEVVGAVLHVGGADMARGRSVNAGNVAASALDALSGKSMPVEMRCEMGVEVFFITFTIPFRARLVAPRP